MKSLTLKRILFLIFVSVLILVSYGFTNKDLNKLKLRSGYKIEVWIENVPNARSMALGSQGTLFIGTRSEGKVYAVPNALESAHKQATTIASDLNMPNGIAFKDGSLYVAEIHRILRFDQIESSLQSNENKPKFTIWYDQLPTETHHGWRYIAFGPDRNLYVSIGAPCNICKSSDPRFASIIRINPDTKQSEIFAHGVRNSVGFDWNPQTKELWFTDNGRDYLGDNAPPDELNRSSQEGLHFGYPYCHGGTISDPQFGNERKCSEFQKPAINLGPHVAALGMKFWNNQIIIAEHGSWNSTRPVGYRITSVDITGNEAKNYSPLAEGWLQNDNPIGRPVDILVIDSKSFLVSDDYAGVIYKITKTR